MFFRSLIPEYSGKVRNLLKIDECTLLIVVTDRVFAYDDILSTGIPDKGAILGQMSGTSKNPPSHAFSPSIDPPSPATPELLVNTFTSRWSEYL